MNDAPTTHSDLGTLQAECRVTRPRIMDMSLAEIKKDEDIMAAVRMARGTSSQAAADANAAAIQSKERLQSEMKFNQALQDWRKQVRYMRDYGATPFTVMIALMGGPKHVNPGEDAKVCRCRACANCFNHHQTRAVQAFIEEKFFDMTHLQSFMRQVEYLDKRYNGPTQHFHQCPRVSTEALNLDAGARRHLGVDFATLEMRVLAWLNGKTTDGQPTKEEVDMLVKNGWHCAEAVELKMRQSLKLHGTVTGRDSGRLENVKITISRRDNSNLFNDLKKYLEGPPIKHFSIPSENRMSLDGNRNMEASLEMERKHEEQCVAKRRSRKKARREQHGLTFGGTYATEHKVKRRVYSNLLTTMPETMSGAVPFNLLNKGR